MQKLIIHRLGPLSHCELDIKESMVFTGPQASGKSTVAKSVFFFKNIKTLLFSQLQKQIFFRGSADEDKFLSTKNRLLREIRSNFLQIFGSTWCMDNSMYLHYCYTEETYIKVSLKEDAVSPNYIWIEFSENLVQFLNALESHIYQSREIFVSVEISFLKEEINKFFGDDREPVYIPAGRSMMTLLSTQLNYIYSSMDDNQKRSLDYCTQNYLEKILQIKPDFSVSVMQMIKDTISLTDTKVNKTLVTKAAELMRQIMQGEYRNVAGEERLQVSEERYVKINFASSGQQESVWILNVLFYYLLNNKKAYFIIEEPESHLFPNAQKLMAEFIMLVCRDENQAFITTHSPYILGTINNLLYANRISKIVNEEELSAIVDKSKWLSFSKISAFFIKGGNVSSCTDDEFEAIQNEVIDGASEDINLEYEKMVLLKEKYEQRGMD